MTDPFINILLASIPGVIVALLSYYLTILNSGLQARQLRLNTRRLIALEVDANVTALQTFWNTLNALDEAPQGKKAEEHLASLTGKGLLTYMPPRWTSTHWDRLPAVAITAFSARELDLINTHYRGIPDAYDLFLKIVTLTPDEREMLNKDRFWYNRFADWRSPMYERLSNQVNVILAAGTIKP